MNQTELKTFNAFWRLRRETVWNTIPYGLPVQMHCDTSAVQTRNWPEEISVPSENLDRFTKSHRVFGRISRVTGKELDPHSWGPIQRNPSNQRSDKMSSGVGYPFWNVQRDERVRFFTHFRCPDVIIWRSASDDGIIILEETKLVHRVKKIKKKIAGIIMLLDVTCTNAVIK